MPMMPWELGPRSDQPEWQVRALLHFPLSHSFPHTNLKSHCAEQWMQPTGLAIGATNGLMRVEESTTHDTFIAWACASDSVVTPWVIRVRRWVGGAF